MDGGVLFGDNRLGCIGCGWVGGVLDGPSRMLGCRGPHRGQCSHTLIAYELLIKFVLDELGSAGTPNTIIVRGGTPSGPTLRSTRERNATSVAGQRDASPFALVSATASS